MAIGLRAKFEGGAQEQYDALHRHMGVDEKPAERHDLSHGWSS
jgi:hypothetical protein